MQIIIIDRVTNEQIDDSKIQEYFPTEHVLNEMMKLYQEIFDLEFKEYIVDYWLIIYIELNMLINGLKK